MVKSPIGKYSGNVRLDPSHQKEPEADNEFSKNLWLKEAINDEEFIEDVREEIKRWKDNISIVTNPDNLDIHLVGQSHIDMAWRWRYEQTRQKGIITFKKAIEHAKMFPGQFNFAASEPSLIQWLIEDAPEVYEELKEVVKNGGIELVGGSWVEPDCMMPSGEAFVRQRLYGMRFYNEHFGILPKVEWFLDSFGYNIGLPQILKKSGAEYFWTSKITWNRQTIFPFVYFHWRSPDGTEILTANFQQNWAPVQDWMKFYIGRFPIKEGGKKEWSYIDEYEDIDEEVDEDPDKIIAPVGIFFGKGDGGHGPTHQEVAFNQAVVKEGFAHWSTTEKFFKALEAYSDKLPIWKDELYLEYHRGTFSVHFEVKRHNRYFENRLIATENLAALLSLVNKDYKYPAERFEQIWKSVLLNQFHDCLPGSSIPEVYDDLWDMWKECSEALDRLIGEWTDSLKVPYGTQVVLSNPLAIPRRSPVFLPISIFPGEIPLDEYGKPPFIKLISTVNEEEVLIGQPVAAETGDLDDTRPAGWWTIVELDSLASKPFKIEIANKEECLENTPFTITPTHIENEEVAIDLDPRTGAMVSLTVKEINEGKNLLTGDDSNLTVGYLDDYPHDHAWNIKPQYWNYPLDIPNDKNVALIVKDKGPIFATLQIRKILGEGPVREKLEAHSKIGESEVIQEITLFSGKREVYLKYESDWKQPWVMLKVIYNTATEATTTVSDQMYCAIERSTRPKAHGDQARYEKIMQKYADLSTPDNKWGIALLNEGKYAYDAEGGRMRLTMLRTPTYPTPAAEAWVNQERKLRKQRGEGEPPRFIDIGFLRCRYALLPHKGGALQDSDGKPNPIVKLAAEEFNSPIIVQPAAIDARNWDAKASFLTSGKPALTCNPEHVEVTVLKRKEWVPSSNLILRAAEICGVPAEHVRIKFDPEIAEKIKSVKAVDLLEREIEKQFNWNAQEGTLTFSIGKFEIVSFELER